MAAHGRAAYAGAILSTPREDIVHIEVIGQYEIVLEAHRNLSNTAWMPFVTIYRGHAASYRSSCVFTRRMVDTRLPASNREQAIEAGRIFAQQRIAAGGL